MKKLLLAITLLALFALPAQASWYSVTNTWTYGQVTRDSSCEEGSVAIIVYDDQSNAVATGLTNQFGYYTSSPFQVNGVMNNADTVATGKPGTDWARHITIIGGGGNPFNFHIDCD